MSELNMSNCPGSLYAIREVDTDKVIWNARGGAYKKLEDVSKKLKRLSVANPDKLYSIIIWHKHSLEPGVSFYGDGVNTRG
jgi:hypothetical protein